MPVLKSVLWTGGELTLWEVCRLSQERDEFRLDGAVVGTLEEALFEVHYDVHCSSDWHAREVTLEVRRNAEVFCHSLRSDPEGCWFQDGRELPAFHGLHDIDLGITPSTNTLPIRRLNLEVGESADLTAVWMRFPSLEVQTLPQRYSRVGKHDYVYESAGGRFRAELEVDDFGLVRRYGKYWKTLHEHTMT